MEGTAVKLWTHRNIPRSAHYAWCNRVDVIIASEAIVRKRIAEHVPPPTRSVSTPVEPGSACSDRAQQSQTNHSHFPGSFLLCVSHSFYRQGFVSIASLEKWKNLLYSCTFLLNIFLSSVLFSYYFPFLKGLGNMRHLEFLSWCASSYKKVYSTLTQNHRNCTSVLFKILVAWIALLAFSSACIPAASLSCLLTTQEG